MEPLEIIGTPIKLKTIEVAQNDFPKDMDWNSAVEVCTQLGDGWRLPTKKELDQIFRNKETIGGFSRGDYWSSTENESTEFDFAWYKNFFKGGNFTFKNFTCSVRAVRDI